MATPTRNTRNRDMANRRPDMGNPHPQDTGSPRLQDTGSPRLQDMDMANPRMANSRIPLIRPPHRRAISAAATRWAFSTE